MNRLGPEEFASLFGCKPSELPADCLALIQKYDFSYRYAEGREHEEILAGVLKKIDADAFAVAGEERLPQWEKGWAENLEAFKKSRDVSQLLPKYFRPGLPVRLFQRYAIPTDPNFEMNWYAVFRLWLFRTYFGVGKGDIYEFGCGSGFNLPVLAALYPEKKVWGLDWAQASVDIVNGMAQACGWKMEGRRFDFFKPDKSFVLAPSSVVTTIGALEQTGDRYHDFLAYLVDSRPALCVHVEPTVQWYDRTNPVDEAAIRFHKKRRYWDGFLDVLADYEKKGRIRIEKKKRSYFGSLYVEGFSQTIWKAV